MTATRRRTVSVGLALGSAPGEPDSVDLTTADVSSSVPRSPRQPTSTSTTASPSSSSRSAEVLNLRADAVLNAVGKEEPGSRAVLAAVAQEHELFLHGTRSAVVRLWLACRLGTEQDFVALGREAALDAICDALVHSPSESSDSSAADATLPGTAPPAGQRSTSAAVNPATKSHSSPAREIGRAHV